MKTKISLFLILIFLAATLSAFAGETKETEASGSASVGYFSDYIWRGMKIGNENAIQPSTGITYGVFGANLWANYDVDTKEYNETDLTLTYVRSFDKLGMEIGYIYYALDGANDTQEFYVALSYDALLSPSLTLYYDTGEGNGGFIVAAIGHSVDVGKDLSLDLGASASYNAKNKVMGTDINGDGFNNFYNGEVSASTSIPIAGNISVDPLIAYSFPLSDDGKDAIEGLSSNAKNDIVYGGITLSLNF